MIFSLLLQEAASGQYLVQFNVVQPDLLAADAGGNHTVATGTVLQLGGQPAAIGGSPPYSYNWSPGYGLNDSTIPNPTLTVDSSITYILLIGDTHGCTAESQSTVTLLVGIDEPGSGRKAVIVTPNPVTDGVIKIKNPLYDGSQYEVMIRNITGQIVYREMHSETFIRVDISSYELSGGVFIVTVNSRSVSHHKIVVP